MEAYSARKLLCIGASADQLARLSQALPADSDTALLIDSVDDLATARSRASAAPYEAVLLAVAEGAAPQEELNRALAALAPLPVILLSSTTPPVSSRELRSRGAADALAPDELSPSVLERSLRLATESLRSRTELQRVEGETEELRRELLELQEFQRNVAIFAHEINSPLTGLLGFLQLIVEEVEEQEQDPDRAAMLRDSLEAATRIRRVMVKLHQITEPVFKKSRLSPRGLLELSQHGETIA